MERAEAAVRRLRPVQCCPTARIAGCPILAPLGWGIGYWLLVVDHWLLAIGCCPCPAHSSFEKHGGSVGLQPYEPRPIFQEIKYAAKPRSNPAFLP